MKITLYFFIIMALLLPEMSHAQNMDNKVLMTVEGTKITAGEFLRMYKKSQEPGKKSDINEYLQQFITFKLKVADAIKEGYDTTRSFKNELNGYKNQLAQNYLTDTKVREELLKKSYQRSLTEINAWHILISMPQNPSAADTMAAWQKASDIRTRILTGESFEDVARSTSDDQSVKFNGGNLGYFTAFQMIMPFEDAAYSLKNGEMSEPVRTPYGYHIIKVTDIRKSKGKVRVAHIMKAAPPDIGEEEAKKAQAEINNIYNKLNEKSSFAELARLHSDHKESATRGGELNGFGAGEIITDFAEAAFSIKDTGNFTKPVRTLYGWHIIKLLEKKTPGSFEEQRSFMESKINQTNLNSLSKKSFVERMKKEYKFKVNNDAYNWFVLNTDTLIIQGLKKYDRTGMPKGNMYSFANQIFTIKDFAGYIEKRGSMVVTRDSSVFIDRSLDTRVSDHIINYENSVLEKKYPEFRYLMNEFHDGILLFEISGKKVWNRMNEDSAGLNQYYEANKSKYLTPVSIDAKIYQLNIPGGEKVLASAYKRYSRKSDPDKRMRDKFNRKSDSVLIIQVFTIAKGDNPEIDNLNWTKGVQSFTKNGFPSLIVIREVLDPVPLELDEVRGEMMTGYQEYLEADWVRQLKEKYNVKIDNVVLEEVKKKSNNE